MTAGFKGMTENAGVENAAPSTMGNVGVENKGVECVNWWGRRIGELKDKCT